MGCNILDASVVKPDVSLRETQNISGIRSVPCVCVNECVYVCVWMCVFWVVLYTPTSLYFLYRAYLWVERGNVGAFRFLLAALKGFQCFFHL